MIITEQFSVYNNLLSKSQQIDNPLGDLLPKDNEHGWHVSRNLLKPLNHLDFLKKKEEIAVRLNLHSIITPPVLFDMNFEMLREHQAGHLKTSDVINHLIVQLRNNRTQISEPEVRNMLQEYATIRHMEFHPSDVCNLACTDCTYGHDDPETKPLPVNFPFFAIKRIAQLKPRSMVVIGGGEPTLFRSEKHRFQEMVEEVLNTNPGICLGLVTNGTYKPKGEWPNKFSWIRLSLDAATEKTYANFRGKPMFKQVIQNFLNYLDYDVPFVGLSFLFAKSNIHEYATVARFVFDLVKKEKPHCLGKVNIQYRPLRHDPYEYDKPFTESISVQQVERAVREVLELSNSSEEMRDFLQNQTNVTAVLGGNSHPPHEFSRCFYSQTFKIVRANGDLRPCFIRVVEPDFMLGNIISDDLETIALNTLYIGASRKPNCDANGCRQCHVNYTFEQGLKGFLKPSSSIEVLNDPMY